MALGVAGWILTFCLAAFIYTRLALKPLRYYPTLVVEVAAGFANRLLPAGTGSLGLHGLYLVRQRHNVAAASVVVGVNNTLGIVGHLLLLTAVLTFGGRATLPGTFHVSVAVIVVVLTAAVAILLAWWLMPWLHNRLTGFGRELVQSLRHYSRQPLRLVGTLGLTMLLTCTYVTVLYCCCQAVGVVLSPQAVFLVFSAGMLGSTVSPTPGGLGGAEAGLFAGFTAYHVAAAPALAAVLLYRLLTYWLPLLPGVIALIAIRRQRLI
jgi:undecaprenyl-diphosphatase